jgi:hypothetical protein
LTDIDTKKVDFQSLVQNLSSSNPEEVAQAEKSIKALIGHEGGENYEDILHERMKVSNGELPEEIGSKITKVIDISKAAAPK